MNDTFYKSQIINFSTIFSFMFLYLFCGLAFKIILIQMLVMVPTLDINITTINLFYLFIVTSMLIVCMCYFLVGTFKYVFTQQFGKKEFVNSAKVALIIYAFMQNSNDLSQKTIDSDMNKLIICVIGVCLFLLIKKILISQLSPNDVIQSTKTVKFEKLKYSWITFDSLTLDEGDIKPEKEEKKDLTKKSSYKWYDASIK